jgi:hypothetical protein
VFRARAAQHPPRCGDAKGPRNQSFELLCTLQHSLLYMQANPPRYCILCYNNTLLLHTLLHTLLQQSMLHLVQTLLHIQAPLEEAMRRHPENLELLRQCCSAFGNVALNANANGAMRLSVVDAVLGAFLFLKFCFETPMAPCIRAWSTLCWVQKKI